MWNEGGLGLEDHQNMGFCIVLRSIDISIYIYRVSKDFSDFWQHIIILYWCHTLFCLSAREKLISVCPNLGMVFITSESIQLWWILEETCDTFLLPLSNDNALTSHLWGRPFKPRTLCEKDSSFLPMVGSLQYRTLTNCIYWFPPPIKLPVVTWPV